jgi:hypothetical protein
MALGRDRDDRGGRLVLDASLPGGKGWAGLWLELGPSRWLADPSVGIDWSRGSRILVRGRGARFGRVAIADVLAAKRDEPVPVGELSPGSTSESTTGDWEVVFPIPDGVDKRRLRSLVVDFTRTSGGRLELDEIWILSGAGPIPPRRKIAESSGVRSRGPLGLWVWNTAEMLDADSPGRQQLLKAIDRWGLTEVYLQLPWEAGRERGDSWAEGDRGRRLALLVHELHVRQVGVHALDGASWFALPTARAELERLTRGLVRFNRRWHWSGAFDALHLDIEPYLLAGFTSPERTSILNGCLGNFRAIRRALGRTPLWLDLPFWYDEPDEGPSADPRPGSACRLERFLDDCLVLADGIVLMDYRTAADGADGLAAHAMGELRKARRAGKPIRIGIETVPLPSEDSWWVDLEAEGAPAFKVGSAAAILLDSAAGRVLVATPSLSTGDAKWVAENGALGTPVTIRFVAGPSPSKVTFFGRSGGEIRAVLDETRNLLDRSGVVAPGFALHELRTIPLE